MKNQLLILSILLFGFSTLHAQRTENNLDAQQTLSKTDKHFFIENKGQWPSEVLYLAQLGGLNTWITKNGMLYEFYKTEEITSSIGSENYNKEETDLLDNSDDLHTEKFQQKDYKRWGHRLAYTLLGNNTEVKTHGKQKQSGYNNYLIGNDASKHASYVGLFKEAVLNNVYDGIDMRYYFDEGSLRYDYIVHPGADPSQIKFNLEGSDKNYLNEKGELVFTTCFGEVKNTELYCYQQQDKIQVSAKFIERANSFSFALGTYNKNETLIIDPLIYSTFLGGISGDELKSSALDSLNNVYLTGSTKSLDFDTTLGAFQTTALGDDDVFVSKLNSTGSNLIFSTYIGGSTKDISNSIAIDNLGNSYITGNTNSSNYITTSGAFQTTNAGVYDAFITKLNATGTAIIFSSYFGGSGTEYGYSIAIDTTGSSFITGFTTSTDLYITPGAIQLINEGLADIFISQINSTGTSIINSTYLGGNDNDIAYSISIENNGMVYITGETKSTDFDITPGAFQALLGGSGYRDAFVTKVLLGSSLIFSTYLGGNFSETGFSLTVDTSQNIYVTGSTNSPDFPLTSNAIQFIQDGFADVFVTKLNPSGTGLIYSTLLGGGGFDNGNSIKLDDSLSAYIVGTTSSNNFDITPGAYQTTFGGGFQDAFIFKLSSSGSVLNYSSYLGGSNNDFGITILVESSDIVHFSGSTNSIDFPTTLGSYQTNNTSTNFEIFNSKMCLSGLKLTSSSNTTNQLICINAPLITVNYSVVGLASITNVVFTGLPAGVFGTWTPNNLIISGLPTVSGTFNYSINTTLDCGGVTVKNGIITVDPLIGVFAASLSPTLCINNQLPTIKHKIDGFPWISNVLGLPAGVSVNLFGDTLYIDGTPTSIGLYNYTITLAGCGSNVFATGTIVVNSCTSVDELSNNTLFTLSPNPSSGIYQLTFAKSFPDKGIIEVFDLHGKLIISNIKVYENTILINLENQPNGMYVLKVKTDDLQEVAKLVKI